MRRLHAQPNKNGRHPKCQHLIYCDIDDLGYGYVITSPALPGMDLFIQNEWDMLETFSQADINAGFGYISDEYSDLFEEVR